MNATPQPGTPIQPPADFPVTWANPEDARYHWTRDREHNPLPITPMFSSFAALTASEGRGRTIADYDESILARYDCTINCYDYIRLEAYTGTTAEMEARQRSHRAKVTAVCNRLAEIWEQEWRPELESHFAFWADFDLHNTDLPTLAAHLEDTLTHGTRLYEIHYRMGPPMWFAIDEFEKYYADLFPGTTPLDAQRLLQGFDNKTLQINRSLYQLSRLARATRPIHQAVQELPPTAMTALLANLPEGRRFLAELRRFLQTYGRRSDLWDWGYPSWEEDPTPVLNHLKVYLSQPDHDPANRLSAAAAERQAAIAEARQRLAGYPRPVVERFEMLLRSAQTALTLTEDHTYYMDFNGFGWVRRVIGELGRRFAAQGRLGHPEDVFYLKVDELRSMIAHPESILRPRATSRRAETRRWARYSEPAELGTRPHRPQYVYSAEGRRMMRYVGGFLGETPSPDESGVLRGQAGSAGKVRGRARVIRSLADAHRLQAGDILVTTTTAPPWTPLFLTAAALVTDAGGLLSHGAVVAREFRIPAVVGTGRATSRIQDGQIIEVDGSKGIVIVEEEKELL